MEYLVPFILATLGIIFNKKMPPAKQKTLMVIILVYIIILLGMRYRVGFDTIGYMKTYTKARSLDKFWTVKIFLERHEPGYLFICAICKSFTKEFWPVQVIMATITNGCIFIFLYRYCRNVFVGIMFYLILQWLYFSVEVMIESAAISIFLLNYRNFENKKWLKFYLISFLSISLHYSAIIIWFLPLVKIIKPNLSLIIICILFLTITPLIEKLGDIISIPSVTRRIEQYTSTNYNLNWRIAHLIRYALPAIAVFAAFRISKLKTDFQQMILLHILLSIGTFSIPIIFSRISNYTTMFVTVAIANFICLRQVKEWIRVGLICFTLATQSFYYYQMYHGWLPYVSIFNPKQITERERIWRSLFSGK